MFDEYLGYVSDFVVKYGYLTVFLGLMLENIPVVGLFFPGLFILIFGGYLAGLGDLSILFVFISAVLGIYVGDNLSYILGYFGIVKLSRLQKISPQLHQLEKDIRDKTGVFLIFFQFPVYSRMLLPVLLGTLQFPIRRWFFLDAIATVLFASVFSLIGYFIGKQVGELELAIDISQYIQWAFLVLFVWWLFSLFKTARSIIASSKDTKDAK